MKKCIVISDSFKGTISSLEICQIAKESIPRFFPQCQVITVPVADGGEGTVDCFIQEIHAEPISVMVHGPYGEEVTAIYARKGNSAIIEMASAAGLPMVGQNRNPELTSTYGVGELITHAIDGGCTHILLGLGGSATNDGGCGCASALGVKFFNDSGDEFVPTGKTLCEISRIDAKSAWSYLNHITIDVMCDVDNPLCGSRGAAAIFGPQKGADPDMVSRLDKGLQHMTRIIQRDLGISGIGEIPGSGAAGGMGAGAIAFWKGKLKSGIEAVLDLIAFDGLMENADLVITGEGRIDGQSIHGKVISGIAKRTQKRNVPLVAIVGGIAEDAIEGYDVGVTAMFSIDRTAEAFQVFAPQSKVFYQRTLEDILRLIQAMKRAK